MNLVKKICNEIYFLKGKGFVGLAVFIGSYIFTTALATLGIGLFVLPFCYIVSMLLLWIGVETLSNNAALIGLVVTAIGGHLFSVLYFAEMNVRTYKEKFAEDDLKEERQVRE